MNRPVVAILGPDVPDVPMLLDSPHSGHDYPDDFAPLAPMPRVRRAEDTAVDELFGEAPTAGIPLLKALFPRIICDVNRARADIDPATIAGELPFSPAPSAKAALGKGVIWMDAPPPPEPTALYAAPLPAVEVEARLARYWSPYRSALTARLAAIRERHGRAIYIDCHSMQSVSTAMHEEGAGIPRADIVLGDRRGTSCAPWLTRAMADALTAEGFEIAVNQPYQGADLVIAHGAPDEGMHALQIEVRRNLYMDEGTLALSDDFASTRARLGRAIEAVRSAVASPHR